MLTHIPLTNVLCFDIETVPQYPSYDDASPEEQAYWNRKAEFLKKGENDDVSTLYQRAGIYAEFGKIICISTGFLTLQNNERQFRIKSFSGDDEKELLLEFAAMLSKFKNNTILCAHNGKEFDFPYISRRMIINNVPLPVSLNHNGKKPWEIPHLDTLELWKFGDYKHYTPLNLLAHILGIPSPKDDIDGSQVHKVYYEENNLQRIVTYCQKDVITVIQILLRLKNEKLLNNDEVLIV